MINIGITGQKGFIGKHLTNTLEIEKLTYNIVHFERFYFYENHLLDDFVSKCDVLVHLAGVNRHQHSDFVFNENINLSKKLFDALNRVGKNIHLIYASSIQENISNEYGTSKRISRELFANNSAGNQNYTFTGLLIPNVFGPFCLPYYNSVVATFSHQLINDLNPKIDFDSDLNLIYVSDLIDNIVRIINEKISHPKYIINPTTKISVSEILHILNDFNANYRISGLIPELQSPFHVKLFNTFRSHLDIDTYFPRSLKNNIDNRGSFTELIKFDKSINGQLSFSITKKNITRGNHYHRRKIERFVVIKGRALIQLRRIGEHKVHEFCLSGDTPAYVDIPIWTSHNIKNIGEEDLYTVFWINELFDERDTDTFFENV